MRVLTSSIVSGTRKDGPRRPPTCGAALLIIALVVLLARSAHTHTSFSASCLTSVLERKIVSRSACSHGTQSFNIRSNWRDSLHIVARLPEHRSLLPAIAYVSIHEYISSPSVSIFIHTSPWLVDFAWLVWLHRPNEDTGRSLKPLWVTRCLVCTANETKCIINASHQSSDVEVPCCSRNTLNLVTHMKIYPVQQHETKVIHSAEIAHVDCSSPH